jgi:hypothetical protein
MEEPKNSLRDITNSLWDTSIAGLGKIELPRITLADPIRATPEIINANAQPSPMPWIAFTNLFISIPLQPI